MPDTRPDHSKGTNRGRFRKIKRVREVPVPQGLEEGLENAKQSFDAFMLVIGAVAAKMAYDDVKRLLDNPNNLVDVGEHIDEKLKSLNQYLANVNNTLNVNPFQVKEKLEQACSTPQQ